MTWLSFNQQASNRRQKSSDDDAYGRTHHDPADDSQRSPRDSGGDRRTIGGELYRKATHGGREYHVESELSRVRDQLPADDADRCEDRPGKAVERGRQPEAHDVGPAEPLEVRQR
jgi:hypothetical protein